MLMVIGLLLLHGAVGADINILWVNEARNALGNETINAVLSRATELAGSNVNINQLETLQTSGEDALATVEQVCGKLSAMSDASASPDLLIDSTLAGKSSEIIKSLSLTLGIPTVSLTYGNPDDLGEWFDLKTDQEQYLVQVRPPGDTMTDVLRKLVEDHNITNAAIIFDDSYAMNYKYRSLLMNIPVRHLINKMKKDDMEKEKQLKMMTDIDLNNIFLLGRKSMIEQYLAVANKLKMYGMKYSWFAMSKESLKDVSCDCNQQKVITMAPMPTVDNKVPSIKQKLGLKGFDVDIGFYYDAAIASLKAISELKDNGMETPTYSKCEDYASQSPAMRKIELKNHLKKANMAPYCYGKMNIEANGVSGMDFDMNINRQEYKSKRLTKTSNVGKWNSDMPGAIDYKTGAVTAKLAATNVYKVVVVIQPPFVMKQDGKYVGYCIDLLEELKNLMNFEYELMEAPDGQYGRMNEQAEWNGMVKELVNRRADMGLGALSVMAERENVIDFTVPYYDLVGITILMKKPKAKTQLFKFLTVLDSSVWGCIIAAYFVTSILMWIFDRWSPYSYQNNMEKYKDDDEKRYFNLKEALWFCMTSLTPQGGGEAPKNLSGRLVAATWWLFGFIIIASYTANLAAFLTVSRLETPVESLEDLSKQYKIQYSPQNGSATMTYFERMAYIEEKFYEIWKDMSLNDSLSDLERSKLAVWDYPVSDKYTKMWQSMKEAGLPDKFEDALDRVRESPSSSEGYAFLGDATDIRYQVLTNCDLQMVGEEFSRKPYALAVQQGSPLKDQFNDAILKLLNQRTLETLKERWWNQNPEKKVCDDDDDSGGGISIYNIGGVFIVIFIGIGLAIITLIFEYWYYKHKKPASRVDSGSKKLQVKQAMQNAGFGDQKGYDTEYRNNGSSNIAPVGNPW